MDRSPALTRACGRKTAFMQRSVPSVSDADADRVVVIGPEDEVDEEANGDPDSLTGEEDEAGFEEMGDWPDEAELGGEFDDAEGDEDEDGGDEEGDEDE